MLFPFRFALSIFIGIGFIPCTTTAQDTINGAPDCRGRSGSTGDVRHVEGRVDSEKVSWATRASEEKPLRLPFRVSLPARR